MPSQTQGSLDYVEVPSCARRLRDTSPHALARESDAVQDAAPKVTTSLPQTRPDPLFSPSSPTYSSQPASPASASKVAFNSISQLLLSSALQLPANAPATPRDAGKGARLLSTKDPLSIPITTVNFKRFVSKSGPIWWLQDRMEDIVMWRRGWKCTAVWMAGYAFLCYFPRLVLLLPHVVILGVLLATHPQLRSSDDLETASVPTPPPAQTSEGSVDWLANVQAIQNLMGAVADLHDFVLPVVPHLTHSSPYSSIILSFTFFTFFIMIPVVYLIPLRLTFLIAGLGPLLCTHPFARHTVFPMLVLAGRPFVRLAKARLMRAIDDDRLEDKHWRAEKREVEIFENERWSPTTPSSKDTSSEDGARSDVGWSKANLKPGERKAWTRGRDGWSGMSEDGNGDISSNLTFALEPGWSFVETEDWRPDLEGGWNEPFGADDNGWVYTNDSWIDPSAVPKEEWRTSGMTRRRRWRRRIYYSPRGDLVQ